MGRKKKKSSKLREDYNHHSLPGPLLQAQSNHVESFEDTYGRRRSSVMSNLSSIQGLVVDNLQVKATKFTKATSFHGISQILESKTLWGKIFWVLVLFVVFSVVGFQLKRLITMFLLNPTLTSISVEYPKDGLEFPPFIVCTLTKINNTRLKERYPYMKQIQTEFSTSIFTSAYSTALMDISYFMGKNTTLTKLQAELTESLGEQSLLSFLQDTTFECRNQFRFCWFQNGEIYDCCGDNETQAARIQKYLLHSGTCFEFQPMSKEKPLKQKLPGPVGGFGFTYWYPNKDLFPSVYNSYDEHAVHLYMSATDAMLEKNPVVLPVGSHAHVSLQAPKVVQVFSAADWEALLVTKTSRLMEDQLGRPTCKEKKLKYFEKYSYSKCQVECLIDTMLLECNCTGIATYGKIPQDTICSPLQSFFCFKRLAHEFTEILTICRTEECNEGCEYWNYQPSLTIGPTFSPAQQERMIEYWRLPTDYNPDLSLIVADVYFADIQYTNINQMPAFSLETFVSNVGGAMGLWTGASIITWIHLVYFCICTFFCKKRKQEMKAELV